MYKIYGIQQGEKEIDHSLFLPRVVPGGTMGRIGFYMWCIKGDDATVLVDTGLTDEDTKPRCVTPNRGGIKYLQSTLNQLGVDPATVDKMIVTHLHRDHFSAYNLYPKATFYVQKKDFDFLTGPMAKFRQVSQASANMTEVRSLVSAGRVRFINGDAEIVPGIRVILVGGHTEGSQAVVVATAKGNAVICGDVLQFYRQMEEGVAGMSLNLLEAFAAWDRIKGLASSPDLILPGHETLIMKKFPNPLDGVVEIG